MRDFCLNPESYTNCPRGSERLGTFRRLVSRSNAGLLMPGRYHPLWQRQQRLRARSVLEIARGYPDFPVILNLRECRKIIYDLPALSVGGTSPGR